MPPFAADAYALSAAVSEYATPPPAAVPSSLFPGLAEAHNTSIPVIAIGSERWRGIGWAARYRGTGSPSVDSRRCSSQ